MKNLTKISKLNEKLILDEGDSFKEWYGEPSAYEYARTLDNMDKKANENVPKGYRVRSATSSDNICYIYTPYGNYIIKNGYKNVDDSTITKDKTKLCIIDSNNNIKLSIVYNYSGDEYYGRVFQNLIPVFEYYKGNLPKEIDYTKFEDEDIIGESIKEDIEDDGLLELEEPIDDEPTFDGDSIEDEIDNIEEPTEPITQEVADNAYLNQLNDLITAEYGKIDEVKSIIATFTTEDAIESNSEVISILNAFIDETTIGIGMLTKASELIDSTTNDLMQQGIDKAEDAIKNVDKEEDKKEETEE